ncbi:hypothetical protein K3N28_13455 [Glycomyces sp. TRM65418]|uniref:hypothetical protein n=1 Tax=Glycomyces sp. TRM65418 TaxID=2867006 RepID=UPI001CE64544|nr:hypothetical protein [Glycomyces sp. TRM65418]MCC3764072.1 hypothetical protein [Glycomyces sp. TRM65418]QZD53762.1 hypothetical protein K3N28_13390 [Glycomyces sp. TRM65418]
MGRANLSVADLEALERGRFSDGRRSFTVRASSAQAPDSFQVFVTGNAADIVLIVSGLTSGNLHATWGEEWRAASEAEREWFQAWAFHVFYNGSVSERRRPQPGTVRHCDG